MAKKKLFLAYNFVDELFVQQVSYFLSKQVDLDPYCYADKKKHTKKWQKEVGEELVSCDVFVLFIGKEIGKTQESEALVASEESGLEKRAIFLSEDVKLPNALKAPFAKAPMIKSYSTDDSVSSEELAYQCAKEITQSIEGAGWIPDDGLPIGYPFDYEKRIIREYAKDQLPGEYIEQGCPKTWPQIERLPPTQENRVPESDIGLYRDWDQEHDKLKENEPRVVASALTDYHIDDLLDRGLTFPEAGPRKYLHYPTRRGLTIGIIVSGGIAPGINAVISGIVGRHFGYAEAGRYTNGLTVRGYQNGLGALYHPGVHHHPLTPEKVEKQATLGGSMLGTSRVDVFLDPTKPLERRNALEKAVRRLRNDGIDILYIIGGDGSMKAARALWTTSQELGRKLSIVAIPKTMDNDILWVWQAFGFLSAVERANETIRELYTEAKSNPRLCVIQLFGSDSGFVVTHAALASGRCDLFLIPEVPFTMKGVSKYIKERLEQRYVESGGLGSTHGVIVMAETAIPLDAEDYLGDKDLKLSEEEQEAIRIHLKTRRVSGPTPDALRTGGLKLVSRVLQKEIQAMEGEYWKRFRVFRNEPRHLIRAIPPSTSDVIFAQRLGSLAVEGAMAGYTDFMISQWLTEYVMVPLPLVVLGRKRIPQSGVFLKSARANTGQPADLD